VSLLLPCLGGNPHHNLFPMKRILYPRVVETIERHSMMRPGDCIGIGVSGGADSVALLRLLAELRSQLGVRILVLHFHHQLRGAEADEDELFASGLARQFGFEFVSDRADVAGEARRKGWNLEDAARRLRYQFFASAGASRGLSRVAVAHTADDQAETVLAHLLRGTGPAGLAGIYPVAGLIIRPLLDIRRDELRDYLLTLNQSWREDATNQDTSRMRARIRHQLLPLLQQDFEPATVALLARLAGLAREEETFWRALEDERFAALVLREPGGGVSLGIADLLSPFPSLAPESRDTKRDVGRAAGFPLTPLLALTRRLVRRIFLELCGSRQQLTARHVEDVLHLATKSQSGSRIELPGVLVKRLFDRLVFSSVSPTAEAEKIGAKHFSGPQFEYAIALPSASEPACIVVPEIRRRFNLKVIDWPSMSRETMKAWSILDLDRLRWPLILRNWHPGDSYRPYRRRRVRKLKRLLLESRIPLCDRTGWPVLTSAGALVWALGCPVADEFAPRSGTRAGLVIAEEEF
jgi:tRNA(Ile)-lysidine synthase